MASEEDHTVYGEEDLDEDDESEEEEDIEDEDEEDTSSSNLAAGEFPPSASAAGQVTVAVPGVPVAPTQGGGGVIVACPTPDLKRQRIEDATIAAAADPRKLFQRLWTDEDEIELLQGFLDHTTQRGGNNSSSHHHHDTAAFYDQIKSKLQLDFNKNQLVEKLRRLKKKYRTVVSKMDSGKEFVFKSPHDQATFDISRKIWGGEAGRSTPGGGEEVVLEDEESKPSPNPNPNDNSFEPNLNGVNTNSSEKKVPRSRKRSRGVKIEEKQEFNPQTPNFQNPTPVVATSIPNLIEETVRSCLSPLFKELLHSAANGPCGPLGLGFGGAAVLNPMPLSFGGPAAAGVLGLNLNGSDMKDERWRKQHILELEVYSKRLELVQDQIKLALEELRSMGGG